MKYGPKPGRPEGFCIGARPEDIGMWEDIFDAVQKERLQSVPLQGTDLREVVDVLLAEEAQIQVQLQRAATNEVVERLREDSRKKRIEIITAVFRSLVKV